METPLPPTPALTQKTNILAIISLVTGIVGLLGICVALFLPIVGPICVGVLAIAAVVTGFIGMSQAGKNGEKGKGMAIAGLIIGIVSLLAACLIGVGTALLGPYIGNIYNEVTNSLNTGGY
jgi:hypothetical protein